MQHIEYLASCSGEVLDRKTLTHTSPFLKMLERHLQQETNFLNTTLLSNSMNSSDEVKRYLVIKFLMSRLL